MKAAQNWADSVVGKTTLEQTHGGKYLDSLKLFDKGSGLTGAQAAEIWDIASKRFADGASGKVFVFSTKTAKVGDYGIRTWWRIEKPALQKNPNVSEIIRMKKDGSPVKKGCS